MAYNGRTGPNVSEYIANLNAIPSATDLSNDEEFNLDADLAMFTNTQFFDYDLGHDTDLQAAGDGHAQGRGQEGTVAPDNVDMNSLEFMNGKLFLSFVFRVVFVYFPASHHDTDADGVSVSSQLWVERACVALFCCWIINLPLSTPPIAMAITDQCIRVSPLAGDVGHVHTLASESSAQ